MYVKLSDISDEVKKEVLKDYENKYISVRTMKKKYGLFRNELLAIVGDKNALVDDFADGIIGSSSFVAISDSHIGSIYEKKWYYDYLAEFLEKYCIRDVVVAGDFLQGTLPPVREKYTNPNIQVKHAIELVPVSEKVTWHILFGNHDLQILNQNDKYFKVLKSRRDFHFLGFKRAYMLFGTYLFSISHRTPKYRIDSPAVNADFRLCGHGHYQGVEENGIHLPPFCLDMKNSDIGSPYPGFVVARRFNDEVVFYYYMFEEKISKNPTSGELKKIKERKLEPIEMGKVLSISKTK